MDPAIASNGFSAMGSEARLTVLQCLVRSGKNPLSVGELQERTGIAASTLAHHLKALVGASLVVQEKQGRITYNRAQLDHLEALAAYILEECCRDEEAVAEEETHD